jgi:1-acyl-sn-glycerol-3-phosphate acyltransferase
MAEGSTMLYELIVPFGRLWFRLLHHLRVLGIENMPAHGPALICSNHVSYLDPMVTVIGLPRKVHSLSRKEVYGSPVLGFFIRHLGGVRVSRDSLADKSAIETVLAIMKRGEPCLIYPEGTRSPDGQLQTPKNGAAFLAVKSGAPVIPMAVIGSYECWPRRSRFCRPGPITIRIGEPVYYDLPGTRGCRREELSAISADIMSRIGTLLGMGHANDQGTSRD